jgi:hypothetical protein
VLESDKVATPVAPPVVPLSYVRGDNPHGERLWGCAIQGDARSSTRDQKSVEEVCGEMETCTGYYSNDVGSWFIATDADPAQCATRGKEAYPHFYKKT